MNAALRKNPVLWLVWLLPGAAVLGGFATLAIAMQDADRALPEIYHWEGELLDADFERARTAARLGLQAELAFTQGACVLTLRGATAPTLQLRLINGSDVHLDRLHTLTRGADGNFRGDCAPLVPGRWRVALQDPASTWALRTELDAASEYVQLRARDPEGPDA